MKQKSFNDDVIYASVLQKMITKERANRNASLERLFSVLFCLVSFKEFSSGRRYFLTTTSSVLPQVVFALRNPAAIMPWANNEDWAKKKNVDVPPDMGLEPMTLRLKVWCSTDWANQATHMCYFFVTSAQKPDSRLVIFQLPQLSTRTFLRTQLQSISCCGRTLTTDHKVRSTGKFLAV